MIAEAPQPTAPPEKIEEYENFEDDSQWGSVY
jgi:hypothetical protein